MINDIGINEVVVSDKFAFGKKDFKCAIDYKDDKEIYIILINNKKYLKAGKRFNTKESFQCFYIPLVLFISV